MTKLKTLFIDTVESRKQMNLAPRVIVVAVELPSGAIETITNYEGVLGKLEYYMAAYDECFRLKANTSIQIVGFMMV